MKNEKNITINDLKGHYYPEIWHGYDTITNLSDQTVGYYAYLLQQKLNEIYPLPLHIIKSEDDCSEKDNVLVVKQLIKLTLPIVQSEIVSKQNIDICESTQFELFFRVWYNGVGHPIRIRNGYLLKVIQEAQIKTFEEIDKYNAVLIFNHAKVNPHFCSFVKFEKKKTTN